MEWWGVCVKVSRADCRLPSSMWGKAQRRRGPVAVRAGKSPSLEPTEAGGRLGGARLWARCGSISEAALPHSGLRERCHGCAARSTPQRSSKVCGRCMHWSFVLLH